MMWPAMRLEVSSGAAYTLLRSGWLVITTAITLFGSQRRYGSPMRSSGRVMGMGLRCGGRSVP